MNATQTAILEAVRSVAAATVGGLVEEIGKSETTVRKALKDLAAEGLVENKNGEWVAIVEDDKTDDAPKRRYQRHDTPTTRTTRTNQISKCEVRVVRTDEDKDHADRHNVTTKWMTVCETHDHAVGTDKVLDAHWFSSYPLFCREARKPVQAVVGRRRRDKNTHPAEANRWMPKAD